MSSSIMLCGEPGHLVSQSSEHQARPDGKRSYLFEDGMERYANLTSPLEVAAGPGTVPYYDTVLRVRGCAFTEVYVRTIPVPPSW